MFFNIDNTMDVVSQLVNLGENLFKVYYGRTLNGDVVDKEERDRIKAGIDKTILRNYQGVQYGEQRKSLYLKAMDHLIYSTQYSASTLDELNRKNILNINNYELPHSCQFSNFVRSLIQYVQPDQDRDGSLKMRQHQEVSKQYMIQFNALKNETAEGKMRAPLSPYRGALFYHDMGTGKTFTGVHSAIGWINEYRLPMLEMNNSKRILNKEKVIPFPSEESKGKVVFMFFKRLESTWKTAITRYLGEVYDLKRYFVDHYDDIVTDGILETLDSIDISEDDISDIDFRREFVEDDGFNKIKSALIEGYMKDHMIFLYADPVSVQKNISKVKLEHNLVVIDEVHNIVSYMHGSLIGEDGITTGIVGKDVYHWLMSSKDTKIIGLSGTPIINKPSELLVLANILKGRMVFRESRGDESDTVKGDDVRSSTDTQDVSDNDNYQSLFNLDTTGINKVVNDGQHDIINPRLLSRRLVGLVSRKIREPSLDYPVTFWSEVLPWNGEQVPWFEERLELFNKDTDQIIPLSIGNIRRVNISMSDRQFKVYQKAMTMAKKSYSSYRNVKDGQSNLLLGLASYPLDKDLMYSIRSRDEVLEYTRESLVKLLNDSMATNYSLFQMDTRASGIDKTNLFKDQSETIEFINYLWKIRTTDPDLYNENVYLISSSQEQSRLLYSDAIYRAIELWRGIKTDRAFVSGLFVYDPTNVAEDSPKIARMLDTILDPNNKDLHFVYAHTIIYGAFHIEGYLKANGFEQYIFKTSETDREKILAEAEQEIAKLRRRVSDGKKYYIKYAKNYKHIVKGEKVASADVSDLDMMNTIEYIFNHDRNKNGELIKVLIGTKKAKEGLDLRNVRQVYIMDPWWNVVSVEQAMGRAVRFMSHYRRVGGRDEGFIDPKDRYVKIDLLISVFSDTQVDEMRRLGTGNDRRGTIDEKALNVALNKLRTSRIIEDILNKSAFDCGLYEKAKSQCFDQFDVTETGTSFYPDIMNDPDDDEFNISRVLVEDEYFEVEIDGKKYYRPTDTNRAKIKIEFQSDNGIKIADANILFEKYKESDILIPAYAFVPIKIKGEQHYSQLKYPSFKLI